MHCITESLLNVRSRTAIIVGNLPGLGGIVKPGEYLIRRLRDILRDFVRRIQSV